MIVSPLGQVLAELGSTGLEPEIATAEIDLSLLEKTRREIPLLRRTYVIDLLQQPKQAYQIPGTSILRSNCSCYQICTIRLL